MKLPSMKFPNSRDFPEIPPLPDIPFEPPEGEMPVFPPIVIMEESSNSKWSTSEKKSSNLS